VIAGKGLYNYFPSVVYLGQDQFTYQLSNTLTGETVQANVYVDVGPGISCSVVPDHITQSDLSVNLPEWARTPDDTINPPRYKIEVLGVSDSSLFAENGQPNIDYPTCSLSYTPKPNVNRVVIVTYRVTDVAENGGRYTSRDKTFKLPIDSRNINNPTPVIVPILQLLLLEEEE